MRRTPFIYCTFHTLTCLTTSHSFSLSLFPLFLSFCLHVLVPWPTFTEPRGVLQAFGPRLPPGPCLCIDFMLCMCLAGVFTLAWLDLPMQMKNPIFKVCFSLSLRFLLVLLLLLLYLPNARFCILPSCFFFFFFGICTMTLPHPGFNSWSVVDDSTPTLLPFLLCVCECVVCTIVVYIFWPHQHRYAHIHMHTTNCPAIDTKHRHAEATAITTTSTATITGFSN